MSDATDPGHVTGAHERQTRTTPRVGDSGSPLGSPLTIVLALIAVAAGFLIFRSISDGDGAGADPTATTVPGPGSTVAGQTTTPGATQPTTTAAGTTPPVREGATVVVANASDTGGVAAAMTAELEELGYTLAEPTDQIAGDPNLDTSIVFYVVGNNTEAVAQSLALDMGGLDVEAMPDPIPANEMGTGNVLLMLGNDLAGESPPGRPPAAPAAPTNPTTTAAG